MCLKYNQQFKDEAVALTLCVHRHASLLFPNRKKTLEASRLVTTPLDRGGVQKAMREVVKDCGFKKRFRFTVYATVMPLTQ